jgi:transposase
MANSVQLRALTREERRVLQVKVQDRRLTVRLHRRYRLIAEVARGRSVAEVADRVGCNITMVYAWVHRFNASGFTTFEQPPNPKGRLPIITGPPIRELIDIALSSPAERGLPFSAWTVPKLAAYCRQRGLLPPITDEWVRRLLRREGLRAQRIRTWKTSDDPAFDRKKNASGSSTGRARRGRR